MPANSTVDASSCFQLERSEATTQGHRPERKFSGDGRKVLLGSSKQQEAKPASKHGKKNSKVNLPWILIITPVVVLIRLHDRF
jgi:hypothetical protein